MNITLQNCLDILDELEQYHESAINVGLVLLTEEEEVDPHAVDDLLNRSANVLFSLETYIRIATLRSIIGMVENSVYIPIHGSFMDRKEETVEVTIGTVFSLHALYATVIDNLNIPYARRNLTIREYRNQIERLFQLIEPVIAACDNYLDAASRINVYDLIQSNFKFMLEQPWVVETLQYVEERTRHSNTVYSESFH